LRPPKRKKQEETEMDELWDEKDRQFALAQESFGVSLLRQASQRVSGVPPAPEGSQHEPSISDAANEALERLLEHVVAFPEDQQTEAATMIAYGMIMEHLRLASRMPRAAQSN
jgi:hypothetical protein